jgi:hypothetical protein
VAGVRRHLALTPCLVAGLLLAGCGSNDETSPDALDVVSSTTTSTTTPVFVPTDGTVGDTDDSDDGDDGDGTDASADDTGSSQPASTPPPPGGSSTVPAAPSDTDDDCLVGTWRLLGQPYLESLVRAVDDVGQIESVQERGGQYVFVFGADGSFVGRREAWSSGLGTIQGTIVTTITSDEPGTYRTDGDVVTIESTPNEPIITIRLEEISGSVRDVAPGETLTIGTDPVGGSHPFVCSDTSLTVTLPTTTGATVDATFDRVA